jgi:hypothetical protein
MKMIPDGIDAVAYYGSSVRGDHDHFSDRDVLLVSDDEVALDEGRFLLSNQGCSCACYDWSKLNLLASKKALFIQHLKQESNIIVDKDYKLRSLLARYSPACSYSEHIDPARNLVSLTQYFPDTPQGIGWALDVLTIGFRNLAILTLANEGKYVFSFKELISELRGIGKIAKEHEHSLLSLRKYKASFRKKQFSALPSREVVLELQSIIGDSFDASMESSAISEESFHDYSLHSRKAAQTSQWYLKARLYEGAFLTLNPCAKEVDARVQFRFRAVENALSNPACYSSLFSNSAENLRHEVIELANELGLKAA